jgi:hypothetical protein
MLKLAEAARHLPLALVLLVCSVIVEQERVDGRVWARGVAEWMGGRVRRELRGLVESVKHFCGLAEEAYSKIGDGRRLAGMSEGEWGWEWE